CTRSSTAKAGGARASPDTWSHGLAGEKSEHRRGEQRGWRIYLHLGGSLKTVAEVALGPGRTRMC
ncbi:unnamed protein product, partial [Gulo gulo]